MRLYPDIPVLGLSATNIRYLDGQRDMAQELFDGNVASSMTLGEAIARGILTAPKYVVALYAWQRQFEEYERRAARAKSRIVREKTERYLQALRRALDKADGIDEIFNKHMTRRTGKYLVFTPNFEVLQECMEKARSGEWFGKVDAAPRLYYLYSLESGSTRSFRHLKPIRRTTICVCSSR